MMRHTFNVAVEHAFHQNTRPLELLGSSDRRRLETIWAHKMGSKFLRSPGYSVGIREVFEGIRHGFQGIRDFGPFANTANTTLGGLPDPDQLPFL